MLLAGLVLTGLVALVSAAPDVQPRATGLPAVHRRDAHEAAKLAHRRAIHARATTSCAAAYTPTAAVVTVTGTGILAKPSTFVTKNGTSLYLGSKKYQIVGPNIYWLGNQDNSSSSTGASYPSHQRVREAMAIVVAMGGNTIRANSLGISTGFSYSLLRSKGDYNAAAWEPIDYAVYAAKQYGIRLIVPFTSQYRYYTGGLFDFVGFAGQDKYGDDAQNQFYTNSTILGLFEDYISHWVNHVNQYTGIANKDEPTILGFETGNELGAYMLEDGTPPQPWIKKVVEYIRAVAPGHIIIDGDDGLYDSDGTLDAPALQVSRVDLMSDHYYPAEQYLLNKDTATSNKASKAFFIGEYDWTGQNGGTPISQFIPEVEASTAVGDMLWSVYGHDDNCCAYVHHNDGYSLYYPNGNSWTGSAGQLIHANIKTIVQHWYRQTGRVIPKDLPAVKCKQPVLPKGN